MTHGHQTRISPWLRTAHRSSGHHHNLGKGLEKWKRIAEKVRMVARHVKTHQSRKAKMEGHFVSNENDDLHTGVSRSTHQIWLAKPKHIKLVDPTKYTLSHSQLAYAAWGRETVMTIAQDFSVGQLYLTGYTLRMATPGGYNQPLLTMQPNDGNTGYISGQQAAPTSANNVKIHIKSISYEFEFTNATTAPIEMRLYGVVFKDTYQNGLQNNLDGSTTSSNDYNEITSTYSVVNNWIAYYNNLVSKQILIQGVAGNQNSALPGGNVPATTGCANQSQMINWSPFQYKAYRKMFKGIHKQEILLAPGATRKVEVKVHVNRSVTESQLANLTSTGTKVVKGLTMEWFVIARGTTQLIHNQTPSSLINTAVSTGVVTLPIIVTRKIHWGYATIPNDNTNDIFQDEVKNITTGPFVVEQLNMQDTGITNSGVV